MSKIHHALSDESSSTDFHRLNFVISAPRGGAISFCKRMHELGELGLPHTHLPIRGLSDTLQRIGSSLDLYNVDDGLVRALSSIIYGGFSTNQLEAAHQDINTMYSRDTFGRAYERLLDNSTRHLYDPSFSMALFPDSVFQLEDKFPGAHYIYLFRDPLFYATSILTSIHGLDSLLVWWSIAKEHQPETAFDPLTMWCSINEALLECKKKHCTASSVIILRHPETVDRYSFERIGQVMLSDYTRYTPSSGHTTLTSRLSSPFKRRLTMSTRLRKLIDGASEIVVSPIQAKTSWWLDISLGGDPSANLSHYSNPDEVVHEYWKKLFQDTELIDRCDNLCRLLGFTTLSKRLQKYG